MGAEENREWTDAVPHVKMAIGGDRVCYEGVTSKA